MSRNIDPEPEPEPGNLSEEFVYHFKKQLLDLQKKFEDCLIPLNSSEKKKMPVLSYKTHAFILQTLNMAKKENPNESKSRMLKINKGMQILKDLEKMTDAIKQLGSSLEDTILFKRNEVYQESKKLFVQIKSGQEN